MRCGTPSGGRPGRGVVDGVAQVASLVAGRCGADRLTLDGSSRKRSSLIRASLVPRPMLTPPAPPGSPMGSTARRAGAGSAAARSARPGGHRARAGAAGHLPHRSRCRHATAGRTGSATTAGPLLVGQPPGPQVAHHVVRVGMLVVQQDGGVLPHRVERPGGDFQGLDQFGLEAWAHPVEHLGRPGTPARPDGCGQREVAQSSAIRLWGVLTRKMVCSSWPPARTSNDSFRQCSVWCPG